jgi:hypothetical protein
MSPKSKTPPAQASAPKQVAKKPAREVERGSYTRKEFCARHHISLGTYLAMHHAGLGPREMTLGDKPNGAARISVEADRDWRHECELREIPEADRVAAREKRKVVASQKIDAI